MSESTDGIEEAFEGQLRVLVTAAGQVGERLARQREETQRNAQACSEQEARELASRIEAERLAARVELRDVGRADWWDRATPEQIARSYQVARAWSAEDPEAARAEERVRSEIRGRYGVDVDDAGADPERVRQLVQLELDRAERDRAAGQEQAARAARESVEAQQLLAHANQQDAQAEAARAASEHEPDPQEREVAAVQAEQHGATADSAREDGRTLYDSAERREGTARELESKGVSREVVATRMRADVSQAKPATDAVKGAEAGRGAVARKKRGRVAQVQRTGLDR